MTVLAFACSRPTSSSSVRWLWQSSVLLRPWNCPNVIISVIILCISIGINLSGQGKIKLSQGKIGEKSGNFENLYEWQPCMYSVYIIYI